MSSPVKPDRGEDVCECPACHRAVRPQRPSRLWWIPYVATWLAIVAAVIPVAIFPPMVFVLVPLFTLLAPSPLAWLWARIDADPRCPACDHFMTDDRPAPLRPTFA